MTPEDLKTRTASGLLSFPVTPFNADLGLDLDAYAAHVEWLSGFPAAALFAACSSRSFLSFSILPAFSFRSRRSLCFGPFSCRVLEATVSRTNVRHISHQ